MKKIITIILTVFVYNVAFAGGYQIGSEAKDFSLLNVDGSKVSLSKFKSAKGFIVVFTCNHCPFSQAYEQRIMDLDKKYASKGFPVIAINSNDATLVPEDSYEHMVQLSAVKKYSFPYLYDETQEIATSYGATRTPHVFILQKENSKNIVKYIGAIDNNTDDASLADKKYIEEAVDALLSGKKITTTETKAIGCSIKWKK
jgi:glutathione peroxidase-family protein